MSEKDLEKDLEQKNTSTELDEIIEDNGGVEDTETIDNILDGEDDKDDDLEPGTEEPVEETPEGELFCNAAGDVCVNGKEVLEKEDGENFAINHEEIEVLRAALSIEEIEMAEAQKLKQLDY